MAFTAKIADIIAADKTGLLACHDSWQRVPLCDVASILNGAPFDAAMFNTTRGTPLARIRDVLGGTTSTYYTGDFDNAYLLEKGDLLIGMDGDFNIGYWGARAPSPTPWTKSLPNGCSATTPNAPPPSPQSRWTGCG